MRSRDSRCLLLTLIMLASGVGHAAGATLTVAAGGLDADGCGTKAAPCRSINRAIVNAVDGDKIVVGPGRYGDLDADGSLGEPGEERSSSALLVIDKALTIESVEGAATTLIDAGNANLSVVRISANGVRFGKAKKGFTVARSGVFGVLIDVDVTDATVSGVRAVRNRAGFLSKASGLVFRGNVAEANAENGFSLGGSGLTITGCRATGNTLSGFAVGGNGNVLKANVATANSDAGFDFIGTGTVLTGSIASGNTIGLRIAESSGLTLVGNSFFGNVDTGVLVFTSDVTLTKSNIFGNGSAVANCGVTTGTNGNVTLDKICFGAPTGPGVDPADTTCGGDIAVLEIIEKVLNINPKVPL